MSLPKTSKTAFAERRRALLARVKTPVLLAAGLPQARNYRANRFPFRAKSHFLYFLGEAIPGAALLFAEGRVTLFTDPPDPADALWHGARPSLAEIADRTGVDEARALDKIDDVLSRVQGPIATLPTEDAASAAWLSARLKRDVRPSAGDALEEGSPDAALADAIIDIRLRHDEAAQAQLRFAAEASAAAHIAGMKATRPGGSEAGVAAAMLAELKRRGLGEAYGPIVTVHGEVLHNERQVNPTSEGDLLLADVGGETEEGWAADITRVWPVSGAFSATQRAIYDIVLASNVAAIDKARAGVRYRHVHETAGRVIVEGLRSLGVFRGDVDGLIERGAAAIFFPHGVGHLIGLDVHDMEDLGDRAGYAPGRSRSKRFGDCYLRLDRDLEAGMAVTIEPGFYQVPGILEDEAYTSAVGKDLDREALARFADVRGIRVEDDVLITAGDPDVLTRGVPKDAAAIEGLMREARG
jgi:Xaa-Pro aminopeptidase